MKSRSVKTISDVRAIVTERGLKHVKVGLFDIDGLLRGKYMSCEKFFSALEKGFGFCDVVIGWDAHDKLYDNVDITGWHTGYPDASARVLLDSCRDLPMEENGLFFLCEFAGESEAVCPRAVLRRVLDKAHRMGVEVMAAFEYEFFLFKETAASVREKNYQDLVPLAPGDFGYSVIRNSVDSGVYLRILDLADKMDFPLEGLHEETGPGVLEAAIAYDTASAAADKAALFKTFLKVAAQKQGLMATFMAKWSPQCPGQSGHIHLSLRDENGKALFHDADKPNNVSDLMKWFIGGQQQLMPELMAMIAPTINSYSRLIPGFWAPTSASVGIDNRTCALRVIPGDGKSQRVEYRVAAADANPYLILAAAIASGLWGIEHSIQPTEMVKGNAYEQEFPEHQRLPSTLWDAAQRLRASEVARQYFGDPFVEHFAATREWEEREFRKHITDWELQRYFEII